MQAFTTSNTKTEAAALEKFALWWHYVLCLGTRLWLHFDQVSCCVFVWSLLHISGLTLIKWTVVFLFITMVMSLALIKWAVVFLFVHCRLEFSRSFFRKFKSSMGMLFYIHSHGVNLHYVCHRQFAKLIAFLFVDTFSLPGSFSHWYHALICQNCLIPRAFLK